MTREHGTRSCYQGGCRRPECREANRVYQRAYRLGRRAGGWSGAEDREAEKARVLAVVHCHTTWAAADWAGVSRGSVVEWARYGLGVRRGAGRPSREEMERAKPRPSCGCPMCDEWNDAQAAEATRLYGLGLSELAVGERMGWSDRQVGRWLDRAGVSRRPRVSLDLVAPEVPEGWRPPTVDEILEHGDPVDGWDDVAACKGMDPALFYPSHGEATEFGVAVCSSCPAILDCAVYALRAGEEHGVWGGLSGKQRREIRRRLRLGEAA